ncbi:MAG TPA: glycerol-3-phosphate 1-O-acyltransferase PlsY [Planctomycetota bacterium]|jgi:glycerol-3-phosphate acyltransferase PlsY|nr:glycerol-3-phosphate 1-O-acyltransferase PlsY [Planctomycetota bacterium]
MSGIDGNGVTGILAAAFLGYVLGSIPFGYLLVRLRAGIDVRKVGSGNIGATNVGRVLGRGASFAVFLLDAGKGFAAARLVPLLLGLDPRLSPVLGGLAAIVGHCFPVFLGFRGGKGVATGSGVLLALDPAAFLAGALVWILLLALTRIVSLASIGMSLAYPLSFLARDPVKAVGERLPVFAGSVALAALILLRHRANLRRLFDGTEPRIGRTLGKDPCGPA